LSKTPHVQTRIGDDMEWEPMPVHPKLYHREIVSAKDADALGIRLNSVLWEKIGVGGRILPHYHDVAEIVHITAGRVKLLCNGEWKSFKAGDTFHIPAGAVHSVANDGDVPSEQISIFIPEVSGAPANVRFGTTLVENVYGEP